MDINPLSNTWLANIVSHSVGCLLKILLQQDMIYMIELETGMQSQTK